MKTAKEMIEALTFLGIGENNTRVKIHLLSHEQLLTLIEQVITEYQTDIYYNSIEEPCDNDIKQFTSQLFDK